MLLSLSRARRRPLTDPSLVQFLSSSPLSTGNDGASADPHPQPPPESKPSSTSFLKDVKASLKQEEEKRWTQNPTQVSPNSPPYRVPRDDSFMLGIRKNLSKFGARSSAAPRDAAQGQQQRDPISFQKLYLQNQGDRNGANPAVSGLRVFDQLKESVKRMDNRGGSDNRRAGWNQSSNPGNSSNWRTANERPNPLGGRTVGGSAPLIGETLQWLGGSFTKGDAYKMLGEELKKLRPEQKQGQKGWFSLQELSERLNKLKELEKERKAGLMDVRVGLKHLADVQREDKVLPNHTAKILSQLGGDPDYLSKPPKEHLVEKYFHPDNMSSQEKMKLELAQVREEFKMSESDCGSARVQVALLTTKIKHLSSVLHKKDKHSRKGLQEMVQKRKKLLRYLRRTDWDSYCIVLSKLGLRDNPDYKNL